MHFSVSHCQTKDSVDIIKCFLFVQEGGWLQGTGSKGAEGVRGGGERKAN